MTTLPAAQLPIIRGVEQRRVAVLRAKRRLFTICMLLVCVSSAVSLAVTLSGQANYPGLWAYLATNFAVLALCLGGLLALRNLENVTPLERISTVASVLYLLYWDVTALASRYLPKTEFLMTSVAEFLLAAVLICLVVPRKYLIRALALFFITHELLTWANLLQFPWSNVHNAQLMSDLIVLVTTLCLSLIGTYQHMLATTHLETDIMQLLVNIDPVTGLANPLSVDAQLRAVPNCAVLLLQLDTDPKQTKTAWSEQLLIAVARLLREVVGNNGSVGRSSEQQFVVLLPYASKFAAQQMAEHLLRKFTELPASTTVSIGVAAPNTGEEGTVTRARAQAQLVQAQQAGGNQVCLA